MTLNRIPAPTDLQIVCTKDLAHEEIDELMKQKQSEELPNTTLVIFSRIPLQATLRPAEREGVKALLSVVVNKNDTTISGIDNLLADFHNLAGACPVDIAFEIEGGNQFSQKLSELYAEPPTEQQLESFIRRQEEALEKLGKFNEALKLMRDSGDYNESYTEQEVLDWYARLEKAAQAGKYVK